MRRICPCQYGERKPSHKLLKPDTFRDEYVKNHPELNVVGKHVDDEISGATNTRPQFNAVIERILQVGIQYIIAKNEDRLCRSTEVDGYLQTVCREYGVKIIFLESNSVFNPFDGEQVNAAWV